MHIIKSVTTLLENLNAPIELGNPNIYAEVKLSLFSFMPAQEIVCRETEVFKIEEVRKGSRVRRKKDKERNK